MSVRHLTRSKQIVTRPILNRTDHISHCASYDEVEVMDTSLAEEILARSELFGMVVPSKITPGVFVQVAG